MSTEWWRDKIVGRQYFGNMIWRGVDGDTISAARSEYDAGSVELVQARCPDEKCTYLIRVPRKTPVRRLRGSARGRVG